MNAPSILLVDPDRDSRTIYALILEHVGFQVTGVRDWEEARPLLLRRPPSLVIGELYPRSLRGRTLPEAVQGEPSTTGLPVIVISSQPKPGIRDEGILLGCVAYLTKPCTPSTLVREVTRVIEPGPPALSAAV